MRRIVVPEYLQGESIARLEERFEVTYDPDLYSDRDALLEALAPAAAIVVRNRTQIDGRLLTAAPALEVVGRLGVGLDNIDMEACARRGVSVLTATGANSIAVAEYVLGAMLTLGRGVFGMTESMIAGHWPRQGLAFGRELLGKTLGLVGFGTIARHVARRASAFDMLVVAHDPFVAPEDPAWAGVRSVGLDRLLRDSDFISLHVPLTDQTKDLIGESAFEVMKRGAILINTARGGIVNERALARAVRTGVVGAAALDVHSSEPLGPESRAIFAGLDNLILTPHLAGNTFESVERVSRVTVDAVMAALGSPN